MWNLGETPLSLCLYDKVDNFYVDNKMVQYLWNVQIVETKLWWTMWFDYQSCVKCLDLIMWSCVGTNTKWCMYGDGEAQWISDLGDVRNKLLQFSSTLLGGGYAYDTD